MIVITLHLWMIPVTITIAAFLWVFLDPTGTNYIIGLYNVMCAVSVTAFVWIIFGVYMAGKYS